MSETAFEKIRKGLEQALEMSKCDHVWKYKGTTGHGSNPDCYYCEKCKATKWE